MGKIIVGFGVFYLVVYVAIWLHHSCQSDKKRADEEKKSKLLKTIYQCIITRPIHVEKNETRIHTFHLSGHDWMITFSQSPDKSREYLEYQGPESSEAQIFTIFTRDEYGFWRELTEHDSFRLRCILKEINQMLQFPSTT